MPHTVPVRADRQAESAATNSELNGQEAGEVPIISTQVSARALQVAADLLPDASVPRMATATAHHAPGLGRGAVPQHPRHPRVSVASTDSEGPWDKDDLSYGPSFGPEELQPADLIKIQQLPLQPNSYYVGGVLAKTDNCQIHLGASYSSKTKVIVKRVSREGSAQPFQTHVNEVRCLLRLQHDRIVKLLGVSVSPDHFLDIILEYCPMGALRNYVKENEEPKRLLQLLCDVAEALVFMHGQRFAHLDVKPHNILVQEGEVARAKLCDFGTATRIGASGCLCGLMGTPGYRAPEIEERSEFNAYKADVWSLGKVAEFLETSCGRSLGVYRELLETRPGLRPDMQGCWELFGSARSGQRREKAENGGEMDGCTCEGWPETEKQWQTLRNQHSRGCRSGLERSRPQSTRRGPKSLRGLHRPPKLRAHLLRNFKPE
eukprot:s772_g12.t1